jgi:hypothetical protein
MHHENDNEADLLMGVELIARYLGVTRRQAYRLVYDKLCLTLSLMAPLLLADPASKNRWEIWKQGTPRQPCAMSQTMCRRFPAQS